MSERSQHEKVSRRQALQHGFAGCFAVGIFLPRSAHGSVPGWQGDVLSYLATLARPVGGYAWADQPQSHLSPTFSAVGCHAILNHPVPRRSACADFVRQNHPAAWKKLEQEHREFDLQQIQTLVWLGEEVEAFKEKVQSWQSPVPYLRQYERHGWPVLRHQLSVFKARQLLGLPVDRLSSWGEYLHNRRRPNGSFNNSPDDGSDGDLLNTWWGIEACSILGELDERRAETIAWIQSCQNVDGGFRRQPNPDYATGSDIAYTWAATRCLTALGGRPRDADGAIRYVWSLRQTDGGFSDRPGWHSNAVATHQALEVLQDLSALDHTPPTEGARKKRHQELPDGLRVYSIQVESHGSGSPAEAVALAQALRIHLWTAKNATPEWLAAVRKRARERGCQTQFHYAGEEYGTWIDFPGFGTYSHLSDLVAPAEAPIGPSLAKTNAVSWNEFRKLRLQPLNEAHGRLIYQFGENESLIRTLLDDSVERGGYAAISTFHFGNPDFTNSEPFLKRYYGQLPYITLQDAHGSESWWFADMTAGMRTLFLAEEPTWNGWLSALQNNWTVAVRKDQVTNGQLRMHASSPEVAQFVMDRQTEWQWWDNPDIARPLVSLVIVRPDDEFEAGRRDDGLTIRVRCAWTNTTQGQPKTPLVEFISLELDGQHLECELFSPPGRRGALIGDHAWIARPQSLSPGKHVCAVTVRRLSDGHVDRREETFDA